MMDFDDDCCRFQLPCILSQIVTNYILMSFLALLTNFQVQIPGHDMPAASMVGKKAQLLDIG